MTTTINGRTPEEIKLGLVHCLTAREYRNCLVCPYGTPRKRGMLPCDCEVRQDILALIDQLQEDIQQLEFERDEARNDLDALSYANTELHSAYEAMKRERDAAVEKLPHLCILCKFQPTDFKEKPHAKCTTCIRQRNWEWIGPQEVN